MKRGTVIWVNLSDAHPPEMGKVRPCIVLSNTLLNTRLNTVAAVPLSAQPGEIWPLRVKISGVGRRPSFAIIPGIRQVSKTRLLHAIGTVIASELERVETATGEYLRD